MKREVIRRSVSIPKEVDNMISDMANKYSYSVKNDLYIELIELGIIKFDEDLSMKNMILSLLSKVDILLEKLDNE